MVAHSGDAVCDPTTGCRLWPERPAQDKANRRKLAKTGASIHQTSTGLSREGRGNSNEGPGDPTDQCITTFRSYQHRSASPRNCSLTPLPRLRRVHTRDPTNQYTATFRSCQPRSALPRNCSLTPLLRLRRVRSHLNINDYIHDCLICYTVSPYCSECIFS